MLIQFDNYGINPIQEKDAWRLCDFKVANSDRFKRFFPTTLEQNLTPDLSRIFVEKKVKEFNVKKEFLFTLKKTDINAFLGLIYVKELDLAKKQAELAYCIGYQVEGKGLMTKVVAEISKWAFQKLALKTLKIIAHESNLGSIKVAEKCGYTWQRTLPNSFAPPNEPSLDMELYERYA